MWVFIRKVNSMANDYYIQDESDIQAMQDQEEAEFQYELEMRKKMDYQDYLNELAKGDEYANY
jgi:hypothetical protein